MIFLQQITTKIQQNVPNKKLGDNHYPKVDKNESQKIPKNPPKYLHG